jgi:DNA invertase Pin-like site-specific DNA recombinase
LSKAYGYIRVSTVEQAGTGHSLEEQKKRIEGYCSANGLNLAHIYIDAGVSAGKGLEKRESGKYLSAVSDSFALSKGDTVIATKLDRLFRNALDCLSTVEEWKKRGISMHVMDLNIDTSKPVGNLLLQIMAAVAEMERAQVSERTRVVIEHLKASGRVYGKIPFGQDRDGDRLVLNQAEQKVIGKIKQLRSKGLSMKKIADKLNKDGIPTKTGSIWHQQTVKNVLEA